MAKKEQDILEKYGIDEKTLSRLLIGEAKTTTPLELYLGDKRKYRFALIGDTHLCSKAERLRQLRTFYGVCVLEGISDVFHVGDILDGQGVYKGQEFNLHTFGADNQVDYAAKNYPKVEGVTTYFIIGNHDYAFFKTDGYDIGRRLGELRPDLKYMGAFAADVFIDGIKFIQLVHPDGGMPYALTYRAQKYTEQISSGRKPRIVALGHLHTMYHFDYRNMSVFGVGAFQGQTEFIRRKGISPVIGGWIVEVEFANDKKKSIISVTSKFIKFFERE